MVLLVAKAISTDCGKLVPLLVQLLYYWDSAPGGRRCLRNWKDSCTADCSRLKKLSPL